MIIKLEKGCTMLNKARLFELLQYLYDAMGIKCSLHNPDGTEVYTSPQRSIFCNLICQAKGGYQRCLSCDQSAILKVQQTGVPCQYRCHAGAIDTAIPVMIGGSLAAVILFGQVLDDSPLETQWTQALSGLLWYPDLPELKEAFRKLPRLSAHQIKGCYELVKACVSETRMESLDAPNASAASQKLELYIAENYREPLNLAAISAALNLSVSRLCALASTLSPGMTIGRMISAHRIREARQLLLSSRESIRDIADKVGIQDYNYFTKVFKKHCGLTPSSFRSMGLKEGTAEIISGNVSKSVDKNA